MSYGESWIVFVVIFDESRDNPNSPLGGQEDSWGTRVNSTPVLRCCWFWPTFPTPFPQPAVTTALAT
jgi:hypothetical protein